MKRCKACNDWAHGDNSSFCLRCFFVGQRIIGRAGAKVQKAMREGVLLPPTEYLCVDCGKPAQQHDHRFYSRPLEVDPVCIGCNHRRKHAVDFFDLIREELRKDSDKGLRPWQRANVDRSKVLLDQKAKRLGFNT